MKLCKVCNIQKEVKDFPKNRKSCFGCYNKQQTVAYKKNSISRLIKVKEYYTSHRQEKLDYASAYRKENALLIKQYKKEHAEEIADSWANYYEINRQILLANGRQYTKENPAKMNAKNARRRAKQLQRTPKWLTELDKEKIEEIYFYSHLMTITLGIQHEVDHIIPLCGKNISGLHCPENLQILTKEKHRKKGNKFPYKVV
jgi:5-methylcytosine-specific restriction endonuclease McrA